MTLKIVSVAESFLLTCVSLMISKGKMVIFAWLILATFMLLGLIFLSVMSVGVFVSLIVNLALLPLRIFLWVLRLIFGIF
jgi:hypothetical protein